MTEIVVGFVLSVTFLLSIAGAVFGWLAWRETKRTRPALAQGLRVMADLVEAQARVVHVDPMMTGAPTLRALASEAENGTAAMVRRPKAPEGPRKVRMRPMSDEEEWALEQERNGFEGIEGEDLNRARNWVDAVRKDRLAVAEE